MSPAVRRTLLVLKAVGPCSNRELARVLRISAADCYPRLSYLRSKGLADRYGEELYGITSEGRRALLVGPMRPEPRPDLFSVETEEQPCTPPT